MTTALLPRIARADRNGPHPAWFVSVMVGGDRFRHHVVDDSPAPPPPGEDPAALVAACRAECRNLACCIGTPRCAT